MPDFLIYGMAPSSGMLSENERSVVLDAIGLGMNIVSGLHEFLSDDAELAEASRANGVQIVDVESRRRKRICVPSAGASVRSPARALPCSVLTVQSESVRQHLF